MKATKQPKSQKSDLRGPGGTGQRLIIYFPYRRPQTHKEKAQHTKKRPDKTVTILLKRRARREEDTDTFTQCPHNNSQLSKTSVSGDPVPPLILAGTRHAQGGAGHTRSKTLINTQKNNTVFFFNKQRVSFYLVA